MKLTLLKYKIIIVLLFATALAVSGQQSEALPLAEKLFASTDRNLYIAGERVHFSVFVVPGYRLQPQLSRILYAEIITPDAKQICHGKFQLDDHSASGSIGIPRGLVSGNYYLRVYTKYMRNPGPANYTYVGLKVVNPSRNEVMTGSDQKVDTSLLLQAENVAKPFNIITDKTAYNTHESVTVSVAYNESASHTLGLSISVVPALSFSDNALLWPASEQHVNRLKFYPETRGLTITGVLRDKTTGRAAPLTRVNLSLIGEGRDFMAILSDSLGRYFFALPPYSGSRDLFLCAENKAGVLPEILIDNDFCSVPIELPSPVFILSAAERELAQKMAANTRVREVFGTDTLLFKNTTNLNNMVFYGTPTDILVIDQYVELPTLEEYFNELPTRVKVRKKQGEKYFKVLGPAADMLVYDPLVLVDRVAVDDPKKVLALSPRNINRIEVINEPYTKGNITYGGIVSIISNMGDFAGIDLPESGIFLQYLFLSDTISPVTNTPQTNALPDARNTLFWEPCAQPSAEGTIRFIFQSPETPGRYSILLSGLNQEGEIIRQVKDFEVR